MQKLRGLKQEELNQGLQKERLETTKSMLEGHLTELKALNLRKKWAQITS
jgi:arginine repressor